MNSSKLTTGNEYLNGNEIFSSFDSNEDMSLKDFDSYADAQKRVNKAYKDKANWAKMVMLNTACAGKFSSDRTIEEYAQEIWKLEKVEVTL